MALYIGIMSGTSLDGIDVALVEFSDEPVFPSPWELRGFISIPFEETIRSRMLAASAGDMAIRDVFRLDADLGVAFAEATLFCLDEAGIDRREVEAIGMHGQTVWHAPQIEPAGITVQIGSAAVVAERTGLPVVSDFRSADVAAGGEGAPLVPIFDLLYLASNRCDRVLVNIGGIANLTWIPCRSDSSKPLDQRTARVIAFDTGPGNVLIDAAMRLLYGRQLDLGGRVAAGGRVDPKLLEELLAEPWLQFSPPKSTGRELFGEERGERIVTEATGQGVAPEDIVATLTEFTAATILGAIDRFCPASQRGREVVVGGGGARNLHLMSRLDERSGEATEVSTSDRLGVPSDAKEAICFALLAWLNRHGRPGNIPSVTGASGPRLLGTCRHPHIRKG